ncbi:hypothetical protein KIN20_020241 [Parelaphostrongylus tenuis]|uniref:Uncharacterized protein n=1 Tax=Parelaphostrongylus tenuis TaxID=148309 RepID=A0AAD5MM98_PARTN|nr:hypothetical protein KIN20_020241 [Parelaphostrongylus tenuis]
MRTDARLSNVLVVTLLSFKSDLLRRNTAQVGTHLIRSSTRIEGAVLTDEDN